MTEANRGLNGDEGVPSSDREREEEIGSGADAVESHNALKEALDLAQSVGGKRSGKGGGPEKFGLGNFDDSISLYEYIDEAERRSNALFEMPVSDDRRPVEDLDGLNIAAEFGRPDDSGDDADDYYSEISLLPALPTEDTKDLKSPSMAPPERVESAVASDISGDEVLSVEEDRPVDSPDPSAVCSPVPFAGIVINGRLLTDGALDEIPLCRVLWAVFVEGYTGKCRVSFEGRQRTVYLESGYVSAAESDDPQDSFIVFVSNEKKLVSAVTDQVERIVSEGKTLREALTEGASMRPAELNRLERLYSERLVEDSMAREKGRWRLIPGKERRALVVCPIETSTAALVLRGVAWRLSAERAQTLAPENGVLVFLENLPSPIEELNLTEEERDAVMCWTGSTPLRDSMEQTRNPTAFQALAAALVELQYIAVAKLVAPAEKTNRLTQRAPSTREGMPSDGGQISASLAELTADSLLSCLSDKLEKIKKGTYYEILEVSPDAGRSALVSARDRLISVFETVRFQNAGLFGHDEALQLVRQMVEEAFFVLDEPTRRERYRLAAVDTATDD